MYPKEQSRFHEIELLVPDPPPPPPPDDGGGGDDGGGDGKPRKIES